VQTNELAIAYRICSHEYELIEGGENPLPIGQSIWVTSRANHSTSEDGGKMYGRLPGQCGVIAQGRGVRGPPLYIPPPSSLQPREHHTSYTSCSSHSSRSSYTSRSSLPTRHPYEHTCALIATSGHIGGNDLPWQGLRQLPQHPRQLNHRISRGHRGYSWISFGVLSLGSFFVFIFSPS